VTSPGSAEIDLTISHKKIATAEVTLWSSEENTDGTVNKDFGDYTEAATFCDIFATPSTTVAVMGLSQGEEFSVCLTPMLDTAVLTDMDIIEVEF